MTDVLPTLQDLVDSADKHVDALRARISLSQYPKDARELAEIVAALEGDMYKIKRLLSNVRCDLQAHLNRM